MSGKPIIVGALLIAALGARAGEAAPAIPPALKALVAARVMTLPADKPRAQVLPDGAIAAGDLFKQGKRVAVAVALNGRGLLALGIYRHRGGDWRPALAEDLTSDGRHYEFAGEWPVTFDDLDGDGKPELLLTEAEEATGNRTVSVYTYDPKADTFVAAARGLVNPKWAMDEVRCAWKAGASSGDGIIESWRWRDGRLVRAWHAGQHYPVHEYLIGGGEPAARLSFVRYDEAGAPAGSLTALGNVASFRNELPRGEQPRTMRVQLAGADGVRDLVIVPKAEALAAAKLESAWDELVSRAVLGEAGFTPDAPLTLADGRVATLAALATVDARPAGVGPTYQAFSIGDALRMTFEEPAMLPALAPCSAHGVDWTRLEPATQAYAAGVNAGPSPEIRGDDDVLLALRLPNRDGLTASECESGLRVTALSAGDGQVKLDLVATLPAPTGRAKNSVARPLVLVSLGRLAPGLWRIQAGIKGWPGGDLAVKAPFRVVAAK
jgi:hypothetical protein